MNPSYVLLDEPFTGVDPRSVSELQDVVRYLKQRGLGIVITDHNVRDTLAITDRATVIHQGRILLEGKPDQILADPEVRRVFLGERFEL
jgi:lipopolysaccharide export system ATP-binding protein